MPRYLTVEEAAAALNTTERTVRRMLNAGRLAGSQTEDKGKMVWRVNATKELLEQLDRIELVNKQSPYSADAVTATVTDVFEEFNNEEDDEESELDNKDIEQKTFTTANPAESFWSFMEDKVLVKLQEKDQTIGRLVSELEEKDRQLKLLPDLEKQAEDKRREAEFRALEIEALNKQIKAMEIQKTELEDKANKADALSDDVYALKAQVEELRNPWWKKWLAPKQGDS